MTVIIDGRHIAQQFKNELRAEIEHARHKLSLAVVIVGDNPASHSYVNRKREACADVGIHSFLHALPSDSSEKDVLRLIERLNHDKSVNGILIQLPLPEHLDAYRIVNAVDPRKDVDGLTVHSMGLLMSGHPVLIPCTPQGVLHLIKTQVDDLSGMHAVIIGRSLLFGKPMGQLLLSENCTVTQCHSQTRNIADHCRLADIVISATGQAKMIPADWLSSDAIVIDVGISHNDQGKLCGDVDFESVKDRVKAITPVPGGVGPMTVACLLRNTVIAAKLQAEG